MQQMRAGITGIQERVDAQIGAASNAVGMTRRPARQNDTGWRKADDKEGIFKELGYLFDVGRYHLDRREVKVDIGKSGYFGMILLMGCVIFIAYQALTTNVIYKEVTPIGQIAMWAESGDMSAKADEQETGEVCQYSTKYDYHYGSDNIWDYSNAGCRRVSISTVAFKSTSALHFITYEHLRKEVFVKKTGDSCEEECNSVYPQWPSNQTYDELDRSYLSRTVETDMFNEMRQNNPGMRNGTNILMQKPEFWGKDKCRCFSLENVMNMGLDSAGIAFTHSYNTFFQSGSSKGELDHDPISFLVAQGGSKPFNVFKKGDVIRFSIEEAMAAFGTCLDCQPSEPFYMNALCPDGVCPPGYFPKPSARISGAQIDIRTEYYSHKTTMPDIEGFDWIMENYEPPYAIHVLRLVVDWTSRGSDFERGPQLADREVQYDNYRYGILINLSPAGGIISRWNMSVIVNNIVNFVVLLSFPGGIMSIIVFYGCGYRSKMMRRGKRQVLSMASLYRSFAFNALMAEKTFQSLDRNKNGLLERSELFKLFSDMLLPKLKEREPGRAESWYDSKLESIVDFLTDEFVTVSEEELAARKKQTARQRLSKSIRSISSVEQKPEGDSPRNRTAGITQDEFIRNCCFTEALTWDDLVNKVLDPDCDAPLPEKAGMCCRRRFCVARETKVEPVVPITNVSPRGEGAVK